MDGGGLAGEGGLGREKSPGAVVLHGNSRRGRDYPVPTWTDR